MITSRQNPRLKALRRLRKERGEWALLEGPHLIGEALAAGLPLDEVYAAPGAAGGDPGIAAVLAALPEPPIEVAADVLGGLADADAPKGLLAVARLPRGGIDDLPLPGGVDPLVVYLDGVQDPGNLGAIARAAEAAGATALVLSEGCAHPNHPRALRGSAGSLLRLPVALGASPEACDGAVRRAAAGSSRWLVLAVREGRSLWRIPDGELGGPLVLAVGAEGQGLSAAVAARADLRVTIPLAPPVESLNAAVATALVLFEIRRRRSDGGPEAGGRTPPGPP